MRGTAHQFGAAEGDRIGGGEASRLLGIGSHQLGAIAARGVLTVWKYPGCHPLYSRREVEALAQQSMQPGTLAVAS
jgi:hypothetical protein